MLKSITVTNPKGESLKLELTRPEDSGLIVREITGLGPSQANIVTNDSVTGDGGSFVYSRMENRNILLTLDIVGRSAPNFESVEECRLKTYKYFPIKKKVNILVETDERTAICSGYIERNEPDIFSQNESTQISIICPDPYFYEVGGEEMAFSGAIGKFEFPFSNESLITNLLEFGEIRLDTRANLVYKGDMDTGVVMTIHALSDCKNITLVNVDTREQMRIDVDKIKTITGLPFSAGENIIISTKKTEKYVRLLRDGRYINIISCINKDANWFQISNGDNTFAYEAGGKESSLYITFSYQNAYGGV